MTSAAAPPDLTKPLCFVAMPFGTKDADLIGKIDFDAVYRDLIAAAISKASMEPLRADEERVGGIIHKPMFERLVLCDYVIADLTAANANVFYELGVRHAVKPFTTITIAAEGTRLPFDLGPVRTFFYPLVEGAPDVSGEAVNKLAAMLQDARNGTEDSPVFQLLDGYGPPSIERLRTDAFRDRVQASRKMQQRLDRAVASDNPMVGLSEIRAELGAIADVELSVAVGLLLAYRDASEWAAMDELVRDLPAVGQRTALVREQHALALNRMGRGDEAITILTDLVDERGASSETLGILGRVHKDRWKAARDDGRDAEAAGHLKRAIEVYLQGFESDWRDAYPGINALTLMSLADPPDERRHAIAPVVVYSAQRRIASGRADYWDHATLLEAAVLADDEPTARSALADALATGPQGWQLETTHNNISAILASGEQEPEGSWKISVTEALSLAPAN